MGGTSSPRTPASLHDVELAGLSAAGDRRAFGELVRRHGSAVRGLLRRMGADPATADDVAQDAFLAAFESIAEFRGEGAFAGWVKKIAARLYLRRWRKAGEARPLRRARRRSRRRRTKRPATGGSISMRR